MTGSYVVGLAAAAALGWGSWLVVLYQLSPFTSPRWAILLFFLSLFVALTATFALVIYALKLRFAKQPVSLYYNSVNACLRQGAFLSFMFCLAAVFQRARVLTWWIGLLLIAMIVLLEVYLRGDSGGS